MLSREVFESLIAWKTDTSSSASLGNHIQEEIDRFGPAERDPLAYRSLKIAKEIFDGCKDYKITIERLANSLGSHGVDWTMLGHNIGLDRLREIGEQRAAAFSLSQSGQSPPRPFGYQYAIWKRIQESYRDGDRICFYCSSSNDEWRRGRAQSGYCLVRANKIEIVLTSVVF
jgi:hypothetical protein